VTYGRNCAAKDAGQLKRQQGKSCEYTKHSHINFCVLDSTWEATEAFVLDHVPNVEAWVKNEHLGFEVLYIYHGMVRKYRPDFIIRLVYMEYLVLEVKGQDTEPRTKRAALWERCEAGIMIIVAMYSAIKKHSVLDGLLILGDLSIQDNIKSLSSLAKPFQVGMDNGARRSLVPLDNKRNFLEVSGDIVERVDPIFFSDLMTAAMKALGMT